MLTIVHPCARLWWFRQPVWASGTPIFGATHDESKLSRAGVTDEYPQNRIEFDAAGLTAPRTRRRLVVRRRTCPVAAGVLQHLAAFGFAPGDLVGQREVHRRELVIRRAFLLERRADLLERRAARLHQRDDDLHQREQRRRT